MFSCEFYELFKKIYFKDHLRTAGSKTPLWGFLFNEVASLTAWRPLPVLERDSISELCVIFKKFFVEHLLATPYCMMFFLFIYLFLKVSEDCSLKSVYLVKQW